MDMCGCVFSSLTSQPTQAAPCNHAEYQQPFSPGLFLHGYHGFCFGFGHAEIDAEIRQFVSVSSKYSRLCWPNVYLGPRDSDGERERERERFPLRLDGMGQGSHFFL